MKIESRKRKTFEKKLGKVAIREKFVTFALVKPRWRNGRRARFRCECREACRFESYSGHLKGDFLQKVPFSFTRVGVIQRVSYRLRRLPLLCRLFLLAARHSVQAPSALAPLRRLSLFCRLFLLAARHSVQAPSALAPLRRLRFPYQTEIQNEKFSPFRFPFSVLFIIFVTV